jgi:hypothetical protein
VARRADVSTGTVSTVFNRPEAVAEATRVKVELGAADLGHVRGGVTGELAAHWRRNGFATWLFQPAATSWYPAKAPQAARPVPILAEPWPAIPARGRRGRSGSEFSRLTPQPLSDGLRRRDQDRLPGWEDRS